MRLAPSIALKQIARALGIVLEHFRLNHIALWAAVTKMAAHLAAVTAIGQFNTRPVDKCGGSAAAVTEIVAR